MAYAAAWRDGASWPAGPVPISLEFMANAYLIYRNGGLYTYDPSLAPPQCWKTVGTIHGLSNEEQTSGTKIKRSQNAIYFRGRTQGISIAVTPTSGTLSWAFEETPPGNWNRQRHQWRRRPGTRSAGKSGGDPFLDTPGMVFSYQVTPPG